MIEIWSPRWRDRKVLIAKSKVRAGINQIKFTKTPSLSGIWEIDGDVIKSCELESNGKISCYAVPLYLFEEKDDD